MAKKNEIPEITGEEKTVDTLFGIVEQIQDLESKASVFVDKLKEYGKSHISGFGTVNLVGKKASAYYQVQVKHPTINLNHHGVVEVTKLIGQELAAILFNITITGNDIVKSGKAQALRDFIKKHGGDPDEFVAMERVGKAKDPLMDKALFERLVDKEENRAKIFEIANKNGKISGMDAKPSGGFKPKKDE